MATVLDSLKVILGLDATGFHAEIKKIKQELKEITKEQKIDVTTVKKVEAEKDKILDKAVKKRKVVRKKETTEVKKERKEEDEQTKAAEKTQTNTLVDVISKRFAAVAIANKVWNIAKEGLIDAATFERLSSSMQDSAIDLKAYSLSMEMIGGSAESAVRGILDLQSKLDRFQLYGEGAEDLSKSIGMIGADLLKSTGEAKTALELMDDVQSYIDRNPQQLTGSQLREVVTPLLGDDAINKFYAMSQPKPKRTSLQEIAQSNAKEAQKTGKTAQNTIETARGTIQDVKTSIAGAVGDILNPDNYFQTEKNKAKAKSLGSIVEKLESNPNDPNKVSPAGAMGARQMLPATFDAEAKEMGIKNPNINDLDTNRKVSDHYLEKLAKKFGGQGQALLGYNRKGESTEFKDGKFVGGKILGESQDYLGNALAMRAPNEYKYDKNTNKVTNILSGMVININGDQDSTNKIINEINRTFIDMGSNNTGMQ